MSTLNYTVIDGDNSVDDATIEPDTGSGVPGNAVRVYQYDSSAASENQLMLSSAGSTSLTSTDGLLFVGRPADIDWTDLDNTNYGQPTVSDSSSKINVDGGVRARAFLDEEGRDVVQLLNNLLPEAPLLNEVDSDKLIDGKLGANNPDPNGHGFSQNSYFGSQNPANQDPVERGIGTPLTTFQGFDLNYDVDGSNTAIYNSDVIGRGATGHLEIWINGNRPSTLNDSSPRYSDISDPNLTQDFSEYPNSTSFAFESATNVNFANGETYNEGYQRKVEWRVEFDDLNANEVNSLQIAHYDGGSGSNVIATSDGAATSNEVFYYVDDGTTFSISTLSSPPFSSSPNLDANSKFLSGVEYAQGASPGLRWIVNDIYQTSYSNSGSAISFNTSNCSVPSTGIPNASDVADTLEVGNTGAGDQSVDSASQTASASSPLFKEDVSVELVVSDPIDGTSSTGLQSAGYSLLVDNDFNQSNPNKEEDFIIENGTNQPDGTRLVNSSLNNEIDGDVSSFTSETIFDPTQPLDGSGGVVPDYSSELQVYRRRVVYPSLDFTGDSPSGPNYNGLGGERYYVGYAVETGFSTLNFALSVQGTGTIETIDGSFSASDALGIEVAIGGHSTDPWLDITKPQSDPDGAFAGTNGQQSDRSNLQLNGDTIGIITDNPSEPTGAPAGKLFYRITYPAGSNAEVTDFDVTFIS